MDSPRNVEQPSEGTLNRRQTTTMSDFFRTNDLDKATQDLLIKYDEDGNGMFSKAEVTAIIADLQEQFRKNEELVLSNTMLKRMLIAAIIFFFLLVGSIFGLSFAVASMTKDTSINNGALYTKDGTTVIATDSRADIFQAEAFDFGSCMSATEVESLKTKVVEGKNVMIQTNHEDGNTQLGLLSPVGATFNNASGVACFPDPNGSSNKICIYPDSDKCQEPETRRRLNERREHRKLPGGGGSGNPVPCIAVAIRVPGYWSDNGNTKCKKLTCSDNGDCTPECTCWASACSTAVTCTNEPWYEENASA
jgi:hypothetical protein